MRWAIIGCGDVAARKMAPAMEMTQQCELYAVMRRNLSEARQFQMRFGVPHAYQEIGPILEDPTIDAVYLATPVFLHKEYALLAAKHGKHILCEKPLSVDYASALEMVRTAEECGVLCAVAYYRRYHPKTQIIRQFIQKGGLGSLVSADIRFFDQMSEMDFTGKPWMGDVRTAGGGALMDIGSHVADLLLYCIGQTVTQVAAFRNDYQLPRTVEKTITLLLKTDSGCQCTIGASFDSPRNTAFSICGTHGRLQMNSADDEWYEWVDCNGRVERCQVPIGHNLYAEMLDDFQRCARSGAVPRNAAAQTLQTALLLDSAYRSANTNSIVAL